jgi:hypothetical protein
MPFRASYAARNRLKLCKLPLLLLPFYFIGIGIVSGNCSNNGGIALLQNIRDLDSARSNIQEQYNAHPSDPEIQMTYACLLASGDSARAIYRKIAANEKAPESLQAEANFRLACISYMATNYVKAKTYCSNACKLAGERDNYTRLCSRVTMLADRDSLRMVSDSIKRTEKPIEKNEKKTGATEYYLQVAAFAELENAQGLKKDLTRLVRNVVIKESSSHGKKIFRVRLGPFVGDKEAKAFGDSALAKNKISFRIVTD